MEYGTQLPFMVPGGALYGHAGLNAHGVPFYHQTLRAGRRHDNDATLALRSPLLDEFRANKSRKWELKVSRVADSRITLILGTGYLWLYCGI